ncbi:hypothetical protein FHETE_7432 [Fusarium heterosporum]|uniref:Uncharacterized protein n=1 Tax=Fusarium heterosporum TaxID=42747 RepID=A0A8H5T7R2_FUSHE|nr:hypothetical protein FHETE_7432 [Fusarium heterosporum]
MSLKHLLNPVEEDTIPDDQHNLRSQLILAEQHSNLHVSNDAMEFGMDSLNDFGVQLRLWGDYNGEGPRVSSYVGPSTINPLVSPLMQQEDIFSSDFTHNDLMSIDTHFDVMNMSMDFNFDFSNMIPLAEENHSVASEAPLVLENFQYLDTPTENSREGSFTTSEAPGLIQSLQTTAVVPEEAEDKQEEKDIMVHYGMLHNIEVKLVSDDMSAIDEKLRSGDSIYQYFKPTEYQRQVMLCFPDDNKHFGHLPSATASTLLPLITRPRIGIEPLALKGDLRDIIQRASKSIDARVKVDINIYGPRRDSREIGNVLSDGKLWLQRSCHSREETVYENPHFFIISLPDGNGEIQSADLVVNNEAPKKRTREDQLRKMVEDVYKTVENNREFDLVEGGDRVTRQLLKHQKEALGFMLERESGHINDKYRLWQKVKQDGRTQYRHKITKRRKDIRPEENGGGILADDMGMGKSLSILALVMKTLDNGMEWAKQKNMEHKGRKSLQYSRSTLVVVSAALLVEEWMSEIKKHLQTGLKVVKYHGDRRPKSLDQIQDIEDSDIVVTTYHTLTAEYLVGKGKLSPLYKLGWYRIVLDEAHIIRRPSTKFFQACEYLHANSRWCLSGTPIQNKLADIGSLFRFIRAEPFDKASEFRKWIETAFNSSFEDPELVKDRLVMLLEALCLRRTRHVLCLPKTRQFLRHLDFTPKERNQYDRTRAIVVRNMKHRTGEVEKSSQFGMFQMWLQLRIVCNHGTYQKLFSWHRRNLLEEREAIVGTAGRYGEISCVGCEQPMPVLGYNWDKKSNLSEVEVSERRCPVCVRWYRETSHTNDGQESQDTLKANKRRKKTVHKDDHEHYFNDEGHSTKIRAVVEDVQKDLWTAKSIIFSCWTRTLHLISRHLDKAKIPYLQLDGDSPLAQRKKTLLEFENGDEWPVLIMTTGTGAFGLNLTCANRIFIAELQWNPSVESQAISRAIRLGQENEVRVWRYITRDTVEEDIKQQQEYKKQIAALGFEEEID